MLISTLKIHVMLILFLWFLFYSEPSPLNHLLKKKMNILMIQWFVLILVSKHAFLYCGKIWYYAFILITTLSEM